MRTKYIFLLISICLSFALDAQPPQSFKYQAVVRDADGNLISNQSVDIRISIRNGSAGGTIVYQETFDETTNQFGLVSLNIGTGTVLIGTFSGIDWGSGSKYMQVDYKEGANYLLLGTTELSSVPYALYSNHSADSYWGKTGNNIFYDGGYVGVGTDNPLNDFHVYGSGLFREGGTGLTIAPGPSYSQLVYVSSGGGGYVSARYAWAQTSLYGNIGINESSPAYPLHVKSSTYGTWLSGFHNTNTDASSHGVVVRADGGDPFLVQNASSNLLYVKHNGNVGIGTSTPDAKLHVNDRIRIGEDPSYSTVYGELIHEGGGNGFIINANAGGGSWADMYFQTNNTTRMFIESAGRIGIGTTTPLRKVHIYSTGTEDALYSMSEHGIGVWASSIDDYGLFAQSSVYYAGWFSGSVYVTGTLGKGAGSFIIDHPLDPENKLLRHNFVESPENLLIYRGKAVLDSEGKTTVTMPDYFKALTKEEEASIHITPVGLPFLTGAEWNRDFSSIILYGEPDRGVYWEVLAERDDPVIHELGRPVEEEKGGEGTLCEKGKLLYPKAYGYPASMGRDYKMNSEAFSSNSK